MASAPAFAGELAMARAQGVSASLTCGSFVRVFLAIDEETLVVTEAKYLSNGCGFAIAAAETVASSLIGKSLHVLNGFSSGDLDKVLNNEAGEFPPQREQCANLGFDALRAALADFRRVRVGEFNGESALICSCFGIDEKTIERAVETGSLETVSAVGAITNAGTGCGSCRSIIQEIIDSRSR